MLYKSYGKEGSFILLLQHFSREICEQNPISAWKAENSCQDYCINLKNIFQPVLRNYKHLFWLIVSMSLLIGWLWANQWERRIVGALNRSVNWFEHQLCPSMIINGIGTAMDSVVRGGGEGGVMGGSWVRDT